MRENKVDHSLTVGDFAATTDSLCLSPIHSSPLPLTLLYRSVRACVTLINMPQRMPQRNDSCQLTWDMDHNNLNADIIPISTDSAGFQ